MQKVKLKLGVIKEIPKPKSTWWERAWSYSIDGIHYGTIYKQIYPGSKEQPLVYRFLLHINILPTYWQEVPKNKKGIISGHYKSKSECRKALRASIKTQITYLLESCLKPPH